jgi:glycosyltransferase involved in cell wall biosynthesis
MKAAAPTQGGATSPTKEETAAQSVAPWAAVAVFPFIRENPYQELLYRELERFGITCEGDGDFKLHALHRARRRVSILHFHWPQHYYTWWRRPRRLARVLSWLKLAVFGVRLRVARALGFTIVWTIHEVLPHERGGHGVDRAGSTLLAKASHLLIAHDVGTAMRAEAALGVAASRIAIVHHPSFIGVYPPGRSREESRSAMAIPADSFTFLCFGHIRAYKSVELLLQAFASARLANVRLIIAGLPLDEEVARAIAEAATRDARIVPLLEFIPDDRVAEIYAAADAAVLPRGDGGTSGALILALSMGLPVIAARTPDYEALTGGDDAGWLFERADADSLARSLERAAADPGLAAVKGSVALDRARLVTWQSVAERTAELLRDATGSPRSAPAAGVPAGD